MKDHMNTELNKTEQEVVNGWLNTSVDDLRSTLQCAQDNGELLRLIDAIAEARTRSVNRGHRTRVVILTRFLCRAEKERKRLP